MGLNNMDIRRSRYPAIPFFVALTLHAFGAMCAGHLLMGQMPLAAMVPAFQQGESSLELTLMSSIPHPVAQAPVIPTPQPVVKIDIPVPVEDHESVPVSVETPSAPSVDDKLNLDTGVVEAGMVGSNQPGERADADAVDKGVEGSAYPVSTIRPVYPVGSRLRGEEGAVVLSVRVDSTGAVTGVTVTESSGYSGLDNAAIKAVRKTKFSAALSAGSPRDGDSRVTIRFRLVD